MDVPELERHVAAHPATSAPSSSAPLLRVASGDEEISRPCSPSNPLVAFEVKPRDFYIYYVTVEHPGDLIKWSFYTKKKNIAFGLFHLHSVSGALESGEERLAHHQHFNHDNASVDVHELVRESRSFVSIWPPPKGVTASASLSRSNSQISRAMNSSDGSLPITTSTASPALSVAEAPMSTAIANLNPSPASNQGDFLRATAAFGQPAGSGHPFEFIEIIPVERYESYENTINGSYKVPMAGVYALCFDNSFSFNTSKQVYLGLRVIPASMLPEHHQDSGNLLALAEDENIIISSWMMKKKRKKIQGWAKRWVQLERSGILSYYGSRNGTCRGTINLRQSTLARVPNRRLITIDSPQITFHLKALTDEDYVAWTAALNSFLSTPSVLETPKVPETAATCIHPSDLRDLEKFERGIAERIASLTAAIGDLRMLTATDDGSLARYVGPLEETFGSLHNLFTDLTGYSARLRQVQESLLAAKPIAVTSPEQQAELQQQQQQQEDIFYDLEITDYSESEGEEGSEYADADVFDVASLPIFTPQILPPSNVSRVEFQFRTTLPAPAPPCNISIASILRKSIGKDSSGMVMPMGLNEPLNGLQRLCEELEYSELLDKAALETDSLERLVLVSAFAVSAYASCQSRAERKPFNPMLGETYEYCDTTRQLRFISEKVSHRPLVLACHAATPEWEWWQDQKVKTKFWGKSVEYIPSGAINVRFANGDHFRWTKVISCLRNVLGTNKWIENYGDMLIENLRTGETATLNFKSSGSFFGSSSSSSNEVRGTISDGRGGRTIRLSGRWDDLIMRELDNGRLEVVWKASPFPPLYQEYYGFTNFALRLNQLLPGQADHLPPSDTRLRPDQRMLEEALVDMAEAEQMRLVERQRQVRAEMEAAGKEWEPRWFTPDGEAWIFNGRYWDSKERRDWSNVPVLW